MGIFAVALVASLAACSDDPDSDSPSSGVSKSPSSSASGPSDDPATEVTVDCPEFADTAGKIIEAQAELYSAGGGDASQAIDDLLVELEALKEGAPDDVQGALTNLGSGFQDAAALLESPTKQNQAKLVELAPQLSEDGQKITAYITSECG